MKPGPSADTGGSGVGAHAGKCVSAPELRGGGGSRGVHYILIAAGDIRHAAEFSLEVFDPPHHNRSVCVTRPTTFNGWAEGERTDHPCTTLNSTGPRTAGTASTVRWQVTDLTVSVALFNSLRQLT